MSKNPITKKPFIKRIVINTLISSKLWFIANVFRIPKDLIPEINKIIFGYVWKGSSN